MQEEQAIPKNKIRAMGFFMSKSPFTAFIDEGVQEGQYTGDKLEVNCGSTEDKVVKTKEKIYHGRHGDTEKINGNSKRRPLKRRGTGGAEDRKRKPEIGT